MLILLLCGLAGAGNLTTTAWILGTAVAVAYLC